MQKHTNMQTRTYAQTETLKRQTCSSINKQRAWVCELQTQKAAWLNRLNEMPKFGMLKFEVLKFEMVKFKMKSACSTRALQSSRICRGQHGQEPHAQAHGRASENDKTEKYFEPNYFNCKKLKNSKTCQNLYFIRFSNLLLNIEELNTMIKVHIWRKELSTSNVQRS